MQQTATAKPAQAPEPAPKPPFQVRAWQTLKPGDDVPEDFATVHIEGRVKVTEYPPQFGMTPSHFHSVRFSLDTNFSNGQSIAGSREDLVALANAILAHDQAGWPVREA